MVPRREETVRTSHRVLLRLRHDPAYDFSKISVTYVSRGAPQDRAETAGGCIAALDRDYFEVESDGRTTCIPYHRVIAIRYRGRIVWDREHGDLFV
jgi:uncharacterized protein (UPF0248 family)